MMTLVLTAPVAALVEYGLRPGLRWPHWSQWCVLAVWLAFTWLAAQHTLQKMAGDAGPRWWSNFALSRLFDSVGRDK